MDVQVVSKSPRAEEDPETLKHLEEVKVLRRVKAFVAVAITGLVISGVAMNFSEKAVTVDETQTYVFHDNASKRCPKMRIGKLSWSALGICHRGSFQVVPKNSKETHVVCLNYNGMGREAVFTLEEQPNYLQLRAKGKYSDHKLYYDAASCVMDNQAK